MKPTEYGSFRCWYHIMKYQGKKEDTVPKEDKKYRCRYTLYGKKICYKYTKGKFYCKWHPSPESARDVIPQDNTGYRCRGVRICKYLDEEETIHCKNTATGKLYCVRCRHRIRNQRTQNDEEVQ